MRSYCKLCNEIRRSCCDDADELRAKCERLEWERQEYVDGLNEWQRRAEAAEAKCERVRDHDKRLRTNMKRWVELLGRGHTPTVQEEIQIVLDRAALADDGGGDE